jgi:hypothetical protein
VSAPPLPDVFGNYALGEFVEVVSPGDISWLPQTTGWLWLGAALLAVLVHYGWKRLRRWYHNRYRREAAARLKQLAQAGPQDSWLTELNKLMKLTALAGFSREQVARLSGQEWIDFLNRQCASPTFSPDQGRLLAHGVYEHTAVADSTRQALFGACLNWVQQHRNPTDV